ncbi:MAG: hypothetical protein QOE98_119 [Gaiellaceae bacterium]|nr:hypothetical protein [Gaiellaceae bacterium]
MDADAHSAKHDDSSPNPAAGNGGVGTDTRPVDGTRPSGEARKLLAIYLADHHAGSTAGLELAERAARHNAGNRIGGVLADVVREIEDDRRTLEHLMDVLDIPTSPVKRTMALLAERAARLKLNGHLFTYSPLSRLTELEGLALGILGKLALWESLERVPALQGVGGLDFAQLAERARNQHDAVLECRRQAAELAFST